MHQRDAVLLEQPAHRVEEILEMNDADVLEHADRNDAIVAPRLLAIIPQVEADAVREPGGGGALGRELVLLDGKGKAGDLDIAFLGEIEREPAPAAADIEDALSGLEQQLGGEMALLVELRRLEIVVGPAEIGAGILPVLVEEELVEPLREVIVMGDVLARAMHRIVLLQPAQELAEPGIEGAQRVDRRALHVPRGEVDEIVDRPAVLDRQRAVHIGLADMEPRVEEELAAEGAVVQPDRHLGPGLAGEHINLAIPIDDAQRADGDEMTEQMRQEHRVLSGYETVSTLTISPPAL